MATRAAKKNVTYPSSHFGSVPDVDKYVKRGNTPETKYKWSVDDQDYPNLTLARAAAAKKYNVTSYSPEGGRTPSPTKKHKMPYARRKQQSQQVVDLDGLVGNSAPREAETKPQKDLYNSANRIYVRFPGGVELSLPPNINKRQLDATMKVVLAYNRKIKP